MYHFLFYFAKVVIHLVNEMTVWLQMLPFKYELCCAYDCLSDAVATQVFCLFGFSLCLSYMTSYIIQQFLHLALCPGPIVILNGFIVDPIPHFSTNFL